MEMKKIVHSPIVGWIEFCFIIMGISGFVIGADLSVYNNSSVIGNLPTVMLIYGSGMFWKCLIAKNITFGYVVDFSWIIAIVAIACTKSLDRLQFLGIILVGVGVLIDIFRTYTNILLKNEQNIES